MAPACVVCCCNDSKLLLQKVHDKEVICSLCLSAAHIKELQDFKAYHKALVADCNLKLVKATNQSKEHQKQNSKLREAAELDGELRKLVCKKNDLLTAELLAASRISSAKHRTNIKLQAAVEHLNDTVQQLELWKHNAKLVIKQLRMGSCNRNVVCKKNVTG